MDFLLGWMRDCYLDCLKDIESGLLLGLQLDWLLWEIELGLQWALESGLLLGLQLDWLFWEIELGLLWEIESGLLLG